MRIKAIKKTVSLFLSFLITFTALPMARAEASAFSVTDLKVNYEESPILADGESILFSWKMNSEKIGARQTAYEIRVFTFDRLKDEATDLVYSSGKVYSDKSVAVKCSKALPEGEKFVWYVTVWNEDGVSAESEKEYFTTAPEDDYFDSAQWISAAEKDSTPILSGKFTALKEIAYAQLYASAIGIFDLYINGSRVGEVTSDGTAYDEMKPGWTDYNKRILYYSYDITPYLESRSENGFSAMLGKGWALGKISHGCYPFDKSAFIMKAEITYTDGTTEYFTSSSQWKYSLDSAVAESDIYDGEVYNANLFDSKEVSEKDFDSSSWTPVATDTVYKGQLTAHTGPAVRIRNDLERRVEKITVYDGIKDNGSDYGEINVISEASSFSPLTLKKGQTAVFDLGQNITGWQKITLSAPKNTEVSFDYAEMLNDSGLISRKNDGPEGSLYTENYRSAKADGKYIASGETEETCYSRFTFYGFRYVSVTADNDITISDFSGQVVSSVENESGYIETSDEDLNKLFSNILWSQRGNYLSIPTDCPQRDEKLGWTGDAQIFIGAAAFNADVKAFFDKWLRDLRDSQGIDGRFTDIVPYVPIVGKGNAAWGDAGIIIPYHMYLTYGDVTVIEEMYDSMEKYMAYLATRGYKGANVTYGDWLSYEDNSTVVRELIACAYYANNALLMSEMSSAVGKIERVAYYKELYTHIKDYFRKTFMENGELKASCRTQTCYLMALKTEMFENEKERLSMVYSLCDNIVSRGNRLSTGFVGTAEINEILSDYGKSMFAYTLILQKENPSWLCSVEQGATTVWERWNSYTYENGFFDPSMNSYNHYSYGAVAEWMYTDMLGINADIEAPAFKSILFRFNPDTRQPDEIPSNEKLITYASGEYESAYGKIHSSWKNTGKGFSYNITVPANTSALVYIPISHSNIYFDGKKADSAGFSSDGIKYLGTENGFAVFETASGSFSFEARETGATHNPVRLYFEGNCLKEGFSVYECECGYGYYGEKLDKTDHKDTDGDGKCDVCSAITDASQFCTHICHKGGIQAILWKILRLFFKLFKSNPVCECGVRHY